MGRGFGCPCTFGSSKLGKAGTVRARSKVTVECRDTLPPCPTTVSSSSKGSGVVGHISLHISRESTAKYLFTLVPFFSGCGSTTATTRPRATRRWSAFRIATTVPPHCGSLRNSPWVRPVGLTLSLVSTRSTIDAGVELSAVSST